MKYIIYFARKKYGVRSESIFFRFWFWAKLTERNKIQWCRNEFLGLPLRNIQYTNISSEKHENWSEKRTVCASHRNMITLRRR